MIVQNLDNYLSVAEHVVVITSTSIAIWQSIKLRSSQKQNTHLKMTLTSMLSSMPLNDENAPAVVLGAASLAQTTNEAVVMKDNSVIIPNAPLDKPADKKDIIDLK